MQITYLAQALFAAVALAAPAPQGGGKNLPQHTGHLRPISSGVRLTFLGDGPSGIYPTGGVPTGVFPTGGSAPTGVFPTGGPRPTGGAPFPTGGPPTWPPAPTGGPPTWPPVGGGDDCDEGDDKSYE